MKLSNTDNKRFHQIYRANFAIVERERDLIENTFFDQVFRDSEGNIVIAQPPSA